MVLQPAKGLRLIKRLRKIGLRRPTISEINGITGAVFRIARRGGDHGPFLRGLVPLRSHLKEDDVLQIQGTESTEQAQIDPISEGVRHHRVECLGSINMQFDAGLEGDSLLLRRFFVREMAQKSSIGIRTDREILDLRILNRRLGRQQRRNRDHSDCCHRQSCNNEEAAHAGAL